MLSRLPRISPRAYAIVTTVALASLVIIVLSGAAVRVTGSGLGCPTWPECRGAFIQTELDSHAAIEYGNRLFTGVVSVCTILAALCAFLRRPFRRDLAFLGLLLPLGVVLQAALGGLTVLYDLRPGFVMGHFLLSQLCVAAGFTLMWRAWHEPGARPRVADRWAVWPVRALLVYGGFVLFAGTVATGAGPHAGAAGTGQVVTRLSFWGGGTAHKVIEWHGRAGTGLLILGIGLWLLLWRRAANREVRTAVTAVIAAICVQGAIGLWQYWVGVPAELVWFHVGGATATWLALLWATAAAGNLAPRPAVAPAQRSRPVDVAPERVGA